MPILPFQGEHAVDQAELDGDCRFCSSINQEAWITKSEAGVAVPSVGAMVEGWSLVVPRAHVLSTAQLDSSAWGEFSRLVEETRLAVEARYGPVTIFEHGSVGSGRSAGCGVDHAHFHVVPYAGDLRTLICEIRTNVGDFAWEPSGSRPAARGCLDYIYLSDATGTWITYSSNLPSQVVRQALANAWSFKSWDWKSDLRLNNYLRTSTAIAGVQVAGGR